MKDEGRFTVGDEITLTSPTGAPFSFTVNIRGAAPGSQARSFEVACGDPATGSVKRIEYRLKGREHSSYTDLFEGLARDFGLRLPRNRRPLAEPSFTAPYRALITKNLAPSILYGYGDPAVLRVAGESAVESLYYLVVTSNDAPDSFPVLRSRDLTNWELAGFVFPKGRKPAWAADGEYVSDYWAPEMHRVGGEFRVYFAAREKEGRALAIGVAKSSGPEGPFAAAPEPVLSGNVIDPHVLVEDDGTAFLYWKEDYNGVWPSLLSEFLYEHPRLIAELFPREEDQVTSSFVQTLWPWVQTLEPMERFFVQQIFIEAVAQDFSAFHERLAGLAGGASDAGARDGARAVLAVTRTPVYAQRLSPDGARLVGERVKIIENDQAWEAHLIEGVWVTKQGGRYYLFYAGNDFSTDQYGIGVAVADSALGPYRKMGAPLLSSTAEWSGPGHPSVAAGPDGEPLLFLHAYFPRRGGYKEFRALLAVPVAFDEGRVLLR